MTREDADMEGVMVSGVTGDRNQAKITIVGVPDRPGIAARVFGAVANANIMVDMIIQNVSQASMTDISFTVPKPDLRSAVDLVQRLSQEIGARSVAVIESSPKSLSSGWACGRIPGWRRRCSRCCHVRASTS